MCGDGVPTPSVERKMATVFPGSSVVGVSWSKQQCYHLTAGYYKKNGSDLRGVEAALKVCCGCRGVLMTSEASSGLWGDVGAGVFGSGDSLTIF